MLIVAKSAATLIESLAHEADAPSRSGLRIVVDPAHGSLSMCLATGPATGETVVASGETRVFLSPAASRRLSTRTLRAATTPERSSFFLGS